MDIMKEDMQKIGVTEEDRIGSFAVVTPTGSSRKKNTIEVTG